jgi:Flp pilus assembly CpaE family ATPase
MDIRSLTPLTRLGEVRGNVDAEVFERFVTRHPSGVSVVVANHVPEDTELVSVPAVHLAIEQLRDRSDQLIVDLPANFSEHTLAAIDTARLICLVTTPRLPSMKAARDCLSVLGKIGYAADRVRLVVNFTTPTGLAKDQVVAFFKREPDAVVRYCATFETAADAGRVLATNWPASEGAVDVNELARKLLGELHDGPRA